MKGLPGFVSHADPTSLLLLVQHSALFKCKLQSQGPELCQEFVLDILKQPEGTSFHNTQPIYFWLQNNFCSHTDSVLVNPMS